MSIGNEFGGPRSALFGAVYEARGLVTQRDFAVKLLNKKQLRGICAKVRRSAKVELKAR